MNNNRIIVCGVVCNNEKVLLGRKAKGAPPYPDLWHTPGGGVKDFNKAKDLLLHKKYNDNYFLKELEREIKEETNIKIKNLINICPRYRENPREAVTNDKNGIETHYVFLEYLCDLDSNNKDIKPGDDIAELQWVKKTDLKKIKLTPPSFKMYEELGWL
jgi:8-oxo-dGTP pyrophosphatase MutT (NUDIX family)